MKRKHLFFALALGLCLALFCSAAALAEDDPLKVAMGLETNRFSEPKEVIVSILVTNISERDMPGPVTLYYPNGDQVEKFGSPVLKAGASKSWIGKWMVNQEELDAGKILFKLKYTIYDDEGVLVNRTKIFAKRITYTDGKPALDDEGNDLGDSSFQQLIAQRQQIDARLVQLAANIDHSDYSHDGLIYVSNGSEVRINYFEGSNSKVIVPHEIDGLPVTQFQQGAFKNNESITSVALPDGIKEIPRETFYSCRNLQTVYIPSSVTSIGYGAFAFTDLKSISLPEGITDIDHGAFWYCDELEGVIILPTTLTRLGNFVFWDCNRISGVVIQSSISVREKAFRGSNIKFIYVKEGCMVDFGEEPFESGLELAILPDTVTSIGEKVFDVCNRVTIVCPAGSYAETYAKQHFIMCDTEHYEQYTQLYDAQF